MSNSTEINPIVNATVINQEIGQNTVVNTALSSSTALKEGTLLNNKYRIVQPLNVSTGEADLYICEDSGRKYVAKVYRRQRAVKKEVVEKLKSINFPFIAKLYEVGNINGMPYEILPYYRNGSLSGRQFSLEELKRIIIPSINKSLRILHNNGIIHKDIKPSNIMMLDNNNGVALIDFGISSVVEQGSTVLVTKTGMTPEYSAPETFRNLFLEESDYYSFGITLFELFCGYTPYNNMSAEEIAQYTAVQRIPFSEDMPQDLQDLISGMTYYDITNRNKKNNPNRRWTYTEVENWCKGKKQVVPGEGTIYNAENAIPPYSFLGRDYKDVTALVASLAINWNDGKKQLYRGFLSAFFKNFNPEIANHCIDAEEEATHNTGKDDIVFWKLLYKIYPDLKGFYWKGQVYESLPALGRNMLERLWKNDKSNYDYWDSILYNNLLSQYLVMVQSQNEDLVTAVNALEAAHKVDSKSKRSMLMDYYLMAYLLSGQKIFSIGEKKIKSVHELTAYMKELLDSSYEELEDFCHSMIDYDDTLDVQLEAWLISLGKRTELNAWRQSLSE